MNKHIDCWYITCRGSQRTINQDNIVCAKIFKPYICPDMEAVQYARIPLEKNLKFAVFDGMGGEECGEIASFLAADLLYKYETDSEENLKTFCNKANDRIKKYMEENMIFSMGTTTAIVLITCDSIEFCNLGDSGIYELSTSCLTKLSKNHTIKMYGHKKPALYQYLGICEEDTALEPYESEQKYERNKMYLICSDGLTDMVPETEIHNVLCENEIHSATTKLLEKAYENGARDNISFILLRLG